MGPLALFGVGVSAKALLEGLRAWVVVKELPHCTRLHLGGQVGLFMPQEIEGATRLFQTGVGDPSLLRRGRERSAMSKGWGEPFWKKGGCPHCGLPLREEEECPRCRRAS